MLIKDIKRPLLLCSVRWRWQYFFKRSQGKRKGPWRWWKRRREATVRKSGQEVGKGSFEGEETSREKRGGDRSIICAIIFVVVWQRLC
jgi:hypothetical protein